MRENHYAIFAHLKISQVFIYTISITLLFSNMSWIEFSQSDANLQKNNNHSIIMEIFSMFFRNFARMDNSLFCVLQRIAAAA